MNNERPPMNCRWTWRYFMGIVIILLAFVLLTYRDVFYLHASGQQQLQSYSTKEQIMNLQEQIVEATKQLSHQQTKVVEMEKLLKVKSQPKVKPNYAKPPPGDDWCKSMPKGPVHDGSPWWKYLCLFESITDETKLGGCTESAMMGNWKTCVDKNIFGGSPCLVYSFGIANDFRFDDAMGRRGCNVYSFDPSMGVKDHQRNVNVTFKSIGLGVTDINKFVPVKDSYTKNPQTWTVKTLKSIIKMLGHEKRFIDVLKFDVEAYEWDIMKNIIDDGLLPQIGQVITEWHIFMRYPVKESLERHVKMYQGLRQNGLMLFYKKPFARYHKGMRYNSQCDACYVNSLTSRSKFYASLH